MYDYTQVLFAAALGFFVFGDVPDWLSVLGYVLICGAGVGKMCIRDKRWGDAQAYDLCVNTDGLEISDVAKLVLRYLELRGLR